MAEVDELTLREMPYPSALFLEKGRVVNLCVGGFIARFKVQKSFKLDGFIQKREMYVTIPVSLETLKGLGFISSLKERKK